MLDYKFSVAPMMDWTDRHCRYFHRLLSPHALLYTEMVTTGAIIHGDQDRFLSYDAQEHPIALQLGGSDPEDMYQCAKIAAGYGYDEINLNVGCPSDRVQRGMIGACLMAHPQLVADCVTAMKQGVKDAGQEHILITVKTRLGIDDLDSYEFLTTLLDACLAVGVDQVTLHARKAWLQGLSPKQNRDIPKLDYDRVHRVRVDYPDLPLAINGGIATVEAVEEQLQHVDTVMIGRAAYQNPYLLAELDHKLYGTPLPSKKDVARQMMAYIDRRMEEGVPVKSILRHMLTLFQNMSGAKKWRRYLSENMHKDGVTSLIIEDALSYLPDA